MPPPNYSSLFGGKASDGFVWALSNPIAFDGKRLSQWNKDLKHKHYDSVELKTVTGSKHTYLTRSITGRLNEVPFDVCVVISKRHPRILTRSITCAQTPHCLRPKY
ncbi:hypothetical protein [Acaryochloris sp. CCMEE 5410]|uniref:hypothetical protein n=1 Tax=Acaryochloris sp. CCMEE 5410 TaxID=310037 RepID=UPI0021CEDF87|nr:hypothetical protein [Acaryochloris sp. CCMEE 5410]KAI9129718.1 hypothetical protein ON05_034215 [Acaryochloris sp. CCMEE 5410]